MNTQHTPGPWDFRGMTRAIVSTPGKDGAYATIGHISESLMIGEQEHFANAALIAAAPFMLQILQTIALHAPSLDAVGIRELCDEAIAKAGAAL